MSFADGKCPVLLSLAVALMPRMTPSHEVSSLALGLEFGLIIMQQAPEYGAAVLAAWRADKGADGYDIEREIALDAYHVRELCAEFPISMEVER